MTDAATLQAFETFVRADRAWPRHLRIAHYGMKLRAAKTEAERRVWQTLLDLNVSSRTRSGE